ncbi:MAG: amidohydrolase family protein [Actinobacteria bacterium]|nr:amidohydrolase family protein [Actinomycetota bacterium]
MSDEAQGEHVAEHDLVIRGGSVVDGTGAPARPADVAVRGERIVEVGRVAGAGHREVDAGGALVTPGFVDIHTHYDGQATWAERLDPSSWHGVTTVVMGNCGVGFAPVRDADHDRLIELMEGVEDIPGAALHEGLAWTWRSFAEYLDALADRPHDVDFGAQVPHGALRLHVMGERGARREAATPGDIEAMGHLAREAVEAGALGFTTSRTRNHRTSTGDYTPTLTAEADELVGIATALGASGRGVLQVVSDMADTDEEFGLLERMVAESGRPLSFSLVQSPVAPDSFRDLLARTERANAAGLAITGQVATRAIGVLLGLQCTLNPFLANDVYREIASRPVAEQAAMLRDDAFRTRLLDEESRIDRQRLGGRVLTRFDLMFELGDPPCYEPDPASSVAARAASQGRTPEDLACELLAGDGGRSFLYVPLLNHSGHGGLDDLPAMLAHEHTVPGLSDGGAHVGTICDGSFPTTLLTYWGRDRPEGRLDVPFLVQRHCRDTARTVGLLDRGVLAPGYRADVNVIDFEGLGLAPPEMRYDLPAGGKRLVQRARGYVHTFVAGEETYAGGEATGALPGRLVRGAQPAPTG